MTKRDGNPSSSVEDITMETTDSATEAMPGNSHKVPLSQVLAIALLCGSLTFGCLYTSFRSASPNNSAAQAEFSDGLVAPQPPALADNQPR